MDLQPIDKQLATLQTERLSHVDADAELGQAVVRDTSAHTAGEVTEYLTRWIRRLSLFSTA